MFCAAEAPSPPPYRLRPERPWRAISSCPFAVIVDAGLDQTADVVQVVLLAVIASILAPAVAGFTHLGVGIHVAVGVTCRRRASGR